MAAHSESRNARRPVDGGVLLPIFTLALCVAILPIVAVGVVASTFTLVLALAVLIAFTAGIVALVVGMLGPDDR